MNWLTSRTAPAAVVALLALASCDKGTDLSVDLPDATAISTEYLELTPSVATVQVKPVESLKTDHFLVGRLPDNVAGTTEARAYLNVISAEITDSLPSAFSDPRLDSVVVVMGYDKVYGSATTPARFDIYKLPAKLDDRAVYDSNTPAPALTSAELLGANVVSKIDRTKQVTTAATETSPAVTTTVADQMVRLVVQRTTAVGPNPAVTSQAFTDIFTDMKASGFNQTVLEARLKGLALVPSTSYSSGILSFGRSYSSRIEFYFHDADPMAVTGKWHAYPLLFGPVYSSQGSATARDPRYYTQINTLFAGSPLSQLAQAGAQAVDPSALSNTSYLQEGVGLGTRIRLDNLVGLQQLRGRKGLAINRAELRIPVKPYTNALFPNPIGIFAVETNAANEILQRTVNFVPSDRAVQADGANPRGINNEAVGPLVNYSTTQPYYSLLITNYLQAYLTGANGDLDGELPASLILVPNIRRSSTLSLNRAAIDAANIKLYVYYSEQ
jgi:hypothetical protein